MKDYLVDLMTFRQKIRAWVLVGLWGASMGWFWIWWFRPEHITDWWRFGLNTAILGWMTVLPGYYFYFLLRAKRPNPGLEIPIGWRVAMVVTRAPSEPFKVVKKTLTAMLGQKYPHDTWLADEDPTDEIYKWCGNWGIKVSTRKGDFNYARKEWPRREKCKEGNLAYFYDKFGYEAYDFVAQLDADHVPGPGYLEEMIRPFADSRVGYVSAPSVCDVNSSKSWVARARLYAETTFHGTLQAGYTNGWAPLCIGSHYAVRTKALMEIGGLGPELAEDHSTTLIMNAWGWKGVHAFEAEAHGDGPATFADAMTQEFQWARSLVIILLGLTPKLWKRLPGRLKGQFLFSQLWYPLFGLTLFLGYVLPVVAIFTDKLWVRVDYPSFLTHSTPPTILAILIVAWVKRQGWFRPKGAAVWSWEAVVFQLARWPWVLWATVAAVWGKISNKQFDFRVTPKGVVVQDVHPKVLAPYVGLSGVLAVSVLLATNTQRATGYYYFALLGAAVYLGLAMLVVYKHLEEYEAAAG
ncbi:MAG: putative cellulose synthase [Microgenomates group bacterium Gr01-1014_16]|nr:MAG: putative cellulose synthase [Microgenomates group bacterium Gr01-1014_16]